MCWRISLASRFLPHLADSIAQLGRRDAVGRLELSGNVDDERLRPMPLRVEQSEHGIEPQTEDAQSIERIVSPPRSAPPTDVQLGRIRMHDRIRLPQHQIDRRVRRRRLRQHRPRHILRHIVQVRPRLASRLNDLARAPQQIDIADRIGDVVARPRSGQVRVQGDVEHDRLLDRLGRRPRMAAQIRRQPQTRDPHAVRQGVHRHRGHRTVLSECRRGS